jgi:hypothetical protein
MVIKLKGPKEGGREYFPFHLSYTYFGFSRHKSGQEPNLTLQRAGQKAHFKLPRFDEKQRLDCQPPSP